MSEATPPTPPGRRGSQNWLGIGCYAMVGLAAIVLLVLMLALCSPHPNPV